ncbi:Hypothetical predicted protein [Podarcis lilfordi]|uniref:Uncharacterized protein n=1 Tax=Podarcis lilfordi TaxID=74358 RepID=A0AA35L4T5_9SAUR|nr:Hypothetical predicted protein [Podarcis lilfordi]
MRQTPNCELGRPGPRGINAGIRGGFNETFLLIKRSVGKIFLDLSPIAEASTDPGKGSSGGGQAVNMSIAQLELSALCPK